MGEEILNIPDLDPEHSYISGHLDLVEVMVSRTSSELSILDRDMFLLE